MSELVKPGEFGEIRNVTSDRKHKREEKDYHSDTIVAVVRNATDKKIIWDCRQFGIDRAWFMPHCKVGVTAFQAQALGMRPKGLVVDTYRPTDPQHQNLTRIGE